jgi:HK97 family phage major capsid protein
VSTADPRTTDPAYRQRFPERVPPAPGRPAVNSQEYLELYHQWLRRGGSLPERWAEELRRADQLDRELRDLATTAGSVGGYTVPPAFIARLFAAVKRASAMVRASTVVDTTGGQATSLPLLDDTAVNGAILAEAGAQTVDSATPFASKVLPPSYLYSSRLVKVSQQLAQDSGFPLETWLPRVLGRRIGRGLNAHLTNGTGGSVQPVGLVPTCAIGKTGLAGQTLTIIYDDVVDLIASVDAEYLEPLDEPLEAPGPDQGFIGFMTSGAGLAMLRKVKASDGTPIVTEGVPPKVLGYDCLVNPDVPAPGVSVRSVLFGNFGAGYLTRRVAGDVVVLRLSESFAASLQLAWCAFGRYDGTPADAAAVKCYRNSAT